MSHTVTIRQPSLVATPPKVTNFELKMSQHFMQILGLVFAKKCTFFTQTALCTRKATFKSGAISSSSIAIVKTISLRGEIPLLLIPPPPMSSFWSTPPLGE